MSKHRTIPFGYHMVNGEITTKPDEVLAVLTIFSDCFQFVSYVL